MASFRSLTLQLKLQLLRNRKQFLGAGKIAKGQIQFTLVFQCALVLRVDRQRLVVGRLGCNVIAQPREENPIRFQASALPGSPATSLTAAHHKASCLTSAIALRISAETP